MKLTGNTIFITGGTSGIGRALAEAFHKLGNKVIISGRRRANLDELVAANPGMEAVELDVADPKSIDTVAAQLIADHPDLNVLINNASIMLPDRAADRIDDKLLVDTVATNLVGPIRMTSALVEHLKGKKGDLLGETDRRLTFDFDLASLFVRPRVAAWLATSSSELPWTLSSRCLPTRRSTRATLANGTILPTLI
jgi:uncharacterized oxidoreductase